MFGVAVLAALSLVRLPARGAEPAARPVGVVDLHVDLPYQLGYKGARFEQGIGQFPASELARAGVIGVVLPLFVPARVSPTGPRLEDLEASHQRVVEAISRTLPYASPGCNGGPVGRVQTFLAFEGAGPLAADPARLEDWVARGLRSVGLVHTRNNVLAGSSGEPGPAGGLTEAGRALVKRAIELRAAVDVSHASDPATREVLRLASAANVPVLATHSNARALTDHPRNLADRELRAIAKTRGVIGVNFHSRFLRKGRRASIDDVVRHIRYLVRLVGVDHVGIGSDFEGDITAPQGLEDVRAMPKLADALIASGLSHDAVRRIFGLNALRVLCPSR